MRIGFHLSVGKGLSGVIKLAERLGCETLQMFPRNPRGSKSRPYGEQEILAFQHGTAELDIHPIVYHAPYTYNPITPKEDLLAFTTQALVEDLEKGKVIGVDYVVLHPGHLGEQSPKEGITRLIGVLDLVLSKVQAGPKILVEIMAGSGTELGDSFAQLAEIISGVKQKDRVGVCFDTCHAFAAGYDFTTRQGLRKLEGEIEDTVGWTSLGLVHANDSTFPAGSHRDRHTHIGEGKIGREGFARLISSKHFRQLPFIMETPRAKAADDVRNIGVLKEIRKDVLAV